MRISYASFFSLLLLLVSELNQVSAIHRSHAVRIPEHTCHKVIEMNRCELQKCSQECSKEPFGVGDCRNTLCCSCTFYCKQPPM